MTPLSPGFGERVAALFLDLVRVEGPSLRERPVADWIHGFCARAGIEVREDGAARVTGGNCGNLHLLFPPACGSAREADPWVLLSAHLDVVPPGCCPSPHIDGGIARGDGTVLGGDCRSGCAVLLALAEEWTASPALARPGVQILLTHSEEERLRGSRAVSPEDLRARQGFVLDSSNPPGTIIVETPDAVEVEATFHGRPAHAALHPEEGVSAIRMAAEAIATIRSGRLDPDTTSNIGLVEGGTATNIVAGRARFVGEVRSFRPGGTAGVAGEWREACFAAASRHGGEAEFRTTPSFAGYRLGEDSPVVRRAARAARAIGCDPSYRRTAGGSDANTFNSFGIPSVNLGTGNRYPHSGREEITLADLERLARWVQAIVLEETDGG